MPREQGSSKNTRDTQAARTATNGAGANKENKDEFANLRLLAEVAAGVGTDGEEAVVEGRGTDAKGMRRIRGPPGQKYKAGDHIWYYVKNEDVWKEGIISDFKVFGVREPTNVYPVLTSRPPGRPRAQKLFHRSDILPRS